MALMAGVPIEVEVDSLDSAADEGQLAAKRLLQKRGQLVPPQRVVRSGEGHRGEAPQLLEQSRTLTWVLHHPAAEQVDALAVVNAVGRDTAGQDAPELGQLLVLA